MNVVTITGRLTRDPEEISGRDMKIAKFTIAVKRRFGKNSEQDADYIPCTAFGKTAEFVLSYMKKGTKADLRGRLQQSKYTDKEGNKRSSLEVIAEDVEFGESQRAAEIAKEERRVDAILMGEDKKPERSPLAAAGFMSIENDDDVEDDLPFY